MRATNGGQSWERQTKTKRRTTPILANVDLMGRRSRQREAPSGPPFIPELHPRPGFCPTCTCRISFAFYVEKRRLFMATSKLRQKLKFRPLLLFHFSRLPAGATAAAAARREEGAETATAIATTGIEGGGTGGAETGTETETAAGIGTGRRTRAAGAAAGAEAGERGGGRKLVFSCCETSLEKMERQTRHQEPPL